MTSPSRDPDAKPSAATSPNPRRIEWLDTMSQYISVAKLLAVLVSGALGYFGVTRVEHVLEDQKFLQSISGYISDLKPVTDTSCWTTIASGDALATHVSVGNSGKNVMRLTEIKLQLIDGATGLPVALIQDTLPSIDNGMDMDIPPGKVVQNDNVYRRAHKGSLDIGFQATIEVATSETIMRVAKTVLADRISNHELEAFGHAKIRCLGGPLPQPLLQPSVISPLLPIPPFPPTPPSPPVPKALQARRST